jgi:hypothetical protein
MAGPTIGMRARRMDTPLTRRFKGRILCARIRHSIHRSLDLLY